MDRDLQEEEETGDTMATVEESSNTNQRVSVTPKKRKVRGGAEEKRTPAKSPKRKRMNENIKKYISCRKWREEEEQKSTGQEQQEGEQQQHQHEGNQGDVSHDQVQQEGEQPQHHQLDLAERGGEENKAVTPACRDRMPGSKLQASQGGPCPRTLKLISATNPSLVEVERGQVEDASQIAHQAEQEEEAVASDRRAREGVEESLEELRQEGEDLGHEQGHQAEEQHHDQGQQAGDHHQHHHAQGQQEGDHQQHHPLKQEGRAFW